MNDFKRRRDADRAFPGEHRTTTGLFTGAGGRLLHVDRDGQLRDFSYLLSGIGGIDGSRFGLALGGSTVWFDDLERRSQSYHGDTALVESTYRHGDVDVSRLDITLGRSHLTHVAVSGDVPDDASLLTLQRYVPEGQVARVGRLVHEDAVEVFHRDERDVLHATTTIESVVNQPALSFEDVLAADAAAFPARSGDIDRREDAALGGNVILEVELEPTEAGAEAQAGTGGGASTTLVSLVSDDSMTDRESLLVEARAMAAEYDDPAAIRTAAEAREGPTVPDDHPEAAAVRSDLRVLALLSAETGARIAGPDFDPFYAYSGGYGYTWFRDDAEISRFLLAAEEPLGLDLAEWHERSARFYCGAQLEDGTWPHRVWADTGRIAPGWAHGRIEAGDGLEYQADQTASVVSFLAGYLRERDPEDPGRVEGTLVDALDGLDDSLGDDGLPRRCQNAWENANGRFGHTAATFLGAYASLARAPVPDEIAERARGRADAVHDGLDRLWSEERGAYGMRLVDGLDETRRRRLTSHVDALVDGLYRESGDVAGLVRFEDDDWRRRTQSGEKIWTVSTAWGANAAARLATLLADRGEDPTRFVADARRLLDLLLPSGPLCMGTGYLPEQVFDDGTADSATPLGWPHAIRLATVAHLRAHQGAESRVPACED